MFGIFKTIIDYVSGKDATMERRGFLTGMRDMIASTALPNFNVVSNFTKGGPASINEVAGILAKEFSQIMNGRFFTRTISPKYLFEGLIDPDLSYRRNITDSNGKYIYRIGLKLYSREKLHRSEPLFEMLAKNDSPDRLVDILEKDKPRYIAEAHRLAEILEKGDLTTLDIHGMYHLIGSIRHNDKLKGNGLVLDDADFQQDLKEKIAWLRSGAGYEKTLQMAKDYAEGFKTGTLDDFLERYWPEQKGGGAMSKLTKKQARNGLIKNAGPEYRPSEQEQKDITAKNSLEEHLDKFDISSAHRYNSKTGAGPLPTAARIDIAMKDPEAKIDMEVIAARLQKAFTQDASLTNRITAGKTQITIEDPDRRLQDYLHGFIDERNHSFFRDRHDKELRMKAESRLDR